MSGFPHPETGELIETADEFFKALHDVEERLAPLYRTRSSLQAAYAERHGVAALPERRRRTATQELVARCPRCRQTFSEADAIEAEATA